MRGTERLNLTMVFLPLADKPSVFASLDRLLPACCCCNGKHRCGASKRSSRGSSDIEYPVETYPFLPDYGCRGSHRHLWSDPFMDEHPRSHGPVLRCLNRYDEYLVPPTGPRQARAPFGFCLRTVPIKQSAQVNLERASRPCRECRCLDHHTSQSRAYCVPRTGFSLVS